MRMCLLPVLIALFVIQSTGSAQTLARGYGACGFSFNNGQTCHAVQDMQNLMTFGHACVPQGVSAFLERTNWAKACGGAARPLLPGALLEVVVTAPPKQARLHESP